VVETIANQLGLVSRRVETDLLFFKDFAEARYREGGGSRDHRIGFVG
jgi:hypothetical protein